MNKKQKIVTPKDIELKIRISPLHPEPLTDGTWQFYCSLPKQGSPDIQIVAKTAKRAKEILEDFIYNELDGHENLEDLQ